MAEKEIDSMGRVIGLIKDKEKAFETMTEMIHARTKRIVDT